VRTKDGGGAGWRRGGDAKGPRDEASRGGADARCRAVDELAWCGEAGMVGKELRCRAASWRRSLLRSLRLRTTLPEERRDEAREGEEGEAGSVGYLGRGVGAWGNIGYS